MSAIFKDTTVRKNAPFRYDVVGSFLRPQALKDARAKFSAGEITQQELKAVEDREILRLVEKQKEIGLKAITDGEFRRSWWHLDFMWGLEGVARTDAPQGYQFHSEQTRAETASLTGKIRFGNHPFLEHFAFLQKAAGQDVLARQTLPAPAQFLAELQRGENLAQTQKFYPTQEELVNDIAQAYRDAIQAFYKLGCRNLQLDDCTWGMFCDKNFWESNMQAGIDVKQIAELYLTVNNQAIEGAPEDLAITTHVCRGNYHSTWASSGGYEPIADVLFGRENVSGYYLEYDTDRAGDFAPLRHINNGKVVVLGLVSSKIGALEDRAEIIARIQEAAKIVPADQLCLSPQCGFASTEEGNILTEEEQWEKLRFIKSIAEQVWG